MSFPVVIQHALLYPGDTINYQILQSDANDSFLNFYGPPTFPPYTFYPSTFQPPGIPPGITLTVDGLLSGIFTTPGSYDIFLEIRDTFPGPIPPYRALLAVYISTIRIFTQRAAARYRPIYGGMAS